MIDGNLGEGDTFRPINKKKYDEGYLRGFEMRCSLCKDSGKLPLSHCLPGDHADCPYCNGTGFIEKKK